MEGLQRTREDTRTIRAESDVARKYFSNLLRKTELARGGVEGVDLEGTAPGIAGAVDPGVLV